MPREVVALVSADDVVAAVRVHADRVHDLLRRSGCGPAEAIEVCESYALALIDALVNAPETVGDMAGWWFGRSLELGRRLGGAGTRAAEDVPTSVLSGTAGEAQVRAALAGLPEHERAAVMLRDGYDLPPEAVAVALGRDLDSAALTTAMGRLDLVARHDERRVPDLIGHTGRNPVDLGLLGRLADGSLPHPRTGPLRRHVATCPTCEAIVELLAKGRRLVAGLPVLAMPDDAREAMLERVTARAAAVLPSVDEVLLAIDEDDAVRPAISPLTVVIAIVVALVLGVALAVATTSGSSGQHAIVDTPPPVTSEQPSFSVSPVPTRGSHSPRPTGTPSSTPSSSRSASASAHPTGSTTSRPSTVATLDISPTSGPRNTLITVTGHGWRRDVAVTVHYTGALTSSSAVGTPDATGRFTVTLRANGALPGTYTVSATTDTQQASTSFQQTT